jgi:hypothetical protein
MSPRSRPQAVTNNKAPAARDEAKKFLTDLLADGPISVTEIKETATGHGIGWRTVERAKRDLKIIATKDAAPNGGWEWRLADAPRTRQWTD